MVDGGMFVRRLKIGLLLYVWSYGAIESMRNEYNNFFAVNSCTAIELRCVTPLTSGSLGIFY